MTTPIPDEALRELTECIHDVAGVAYRKTVMTTDLARELLQAREVLRESYAVMGRIMAAYAAPTPLGIRKRLPGISDDGIRCIEAFVQSSARDISEIEDKYYQLARACLPESQ